MVWLTWRQHRAQLLVTSAFVAALCLLMVVRGADAYLYLSWLPVVPLLAGVFWGAPLLARELERGTQRLAWTQSVTRGRWLTAKLGWLGLAVTLLGLALGAAVSAWLATTGARHDRFGDAALFGATGVAAGAWWLFAFVLGAAAGGVTRRLLPALGVTVVLFLVVLFAVFQARDGYAEPVRATGPGATPSGYASGGAWLSPSGAEVADPPECATADRGTYLSCVADAGYRAVLYYQPADRYWRFQWTETAILLLGAALLTAPVAHRVLRRPV